jgi:small subunit ribosomal protein S6e
MPFKINIGEKNKTWKLEIEAPALNGKSLGETVKGSEISPDLAGYELQIMGGSDLSGFPMYEKVEGVGLKGVLLSRGWGMHKRPKKEGKKKVSTPKGLRKRKTLRGKVISDAVSQINLKVTKVGNKKLEEIFPDQNKPKAAPEKKAKTEAPAPAAQ